MPPAEQKPAKVAGTLLLRAHLTRNPNLSQEAFARRCGVSLRSVQRWVNAAVVPTSPALRRAIERGSKGEVPRASWGEAVPETLVASLTKTLEGNKA